MRPERQTYDAKDWGGVMGLIQKNEESEEERSYFDYESEYYSDAPDAEDPDFMNPEEEQLVAMGMGWAECR